MNKSPCRNANRKCTALAHHAWQLGGAASSFRLHGFNFSHQHDARFVQPSSLPSPSAESLDYVSFMNNVVDHVDDHDGEPESPTSSAMVIELDMAQMTARPIRRIMRPDGRATSFGGNVQLLPNGNLWASWASDGYATEHDSNGRLVMETRFRSDRFTTYRAYKSDFKARPIGAPTLKCLAYGTSAATAVTVCFVSWNGATEVQRWRFSDRSVGSETNIGGVVERHGFETRIQLQGYMNAVSVEGLDLEGQVIGTSPDVEVFIVGDWFQDSNEEQGNVVDRPKGTGKAHDEL